MTRSRSGPGSPFSTRSSSSARAQVRFAAIVLAELVIGLAQGQVDGGFDLRLALKRRRDLFGRVVEGRAEGERAGVGVVLGCGLEQELVDQEPVDRVGLGALGFFLIALVGCLPLRDLQQLFLLLGLVLDAARPRASSR